MGKRYIVFELVQVDPLLGEVRNYGMVIAILSWLVIELEIELKDKLNDMKLGVIKTFGKFGGAYPGIAIYSDEMQYFDAEYTLIETTAEKILQEKSANELIRFIADSSEDWTTVASKVME